MSSVHRTTKQMEYPLQANQETLNFSLTLTDEEIVLARVALFAEEHSYKTMIKNCEYLLSLPILKEAREQNLQYIADYRKKVDCLAAVGEKLYRFAR